MDTLIISMNKAQTKGNTTNDIGEGPYFLAIAPIFIIAVGVAPLRYL